MTCQSILKIYNLDIWEFCGILFRMSIKFVLAVIFKFIKISEVFKEILKLDSFNQTLSHISVEQLIFKKKNKMFPIKTQTRN